MLTIQPLDGAFRPFGGGSVERAARMSALCAQQSGKAVRNMMWWHWDTRDRCWRPTLISPSEPLHVGAHARLVPVGAGRRWVLLAGTGTTVNGLPCLPLEVLDDRDEVGIAGERYCFSAQSPPEVVSFVVGTRTMRCARCLEPLATGDAIVRCPACRAHHHAECWTYDPRCQKCRRPTDAVWVPGALS